MVRTAVRTVTLNVYHGKIYRFMWPPSAPTILFLLNSVMLWC